MVKKNVSVNELIQIFNAVDPAGIYFGEEVNAREYEPEAQMMVRKINNILTVTTLAKLVRATFSERFGPPLLKIGDWDMEIARKILLSIK